MKKFITLFFVGLLTNGCASKQILDPESNKQSSNGIGLSAKWVKIKGEKFDIQLNFHNDSNKAVLIVTDDIGCFRGNVSGALNQFTEEVFRAQYGQQPIWKESPLNGSSTIVAHSVARTIELRPNQTKSVFQVCDLDAKASGPIGVFVNRVYENPNNDGTTLGKIVAENIRWTYENDKRSIAGKVGVGEDLSSMKAVCEKKYKTSESIKHCMGE